MSAPPGPIRRFIAASHIPVGKERWKALGAIFALQMAHDLPNALTATMVPTLFVKKLGLPIEYIGLFFLPFLITALKWLWAPIVDNHYSAAFGRRRSWLAPLTVCVALTYIAIGTVEPSLEMLGIIVALLMLKQVFYATQEVAADAYVVENLQPRERNFGSAVVWLGKEAGQIVGFAGLLFVADRYGWQAAFFTAAALFIPLNLPALLRREPPVSSAALKSRARPFSYLKSSVNRKVLAIVFAMSFSVQMPAAIIGPFLGSKGLTLSEIGIVLGIAASLGAILSLGVASVMIARFGPKKMAIAMLFIAPLAAPGFFYIALSDTVSVPEVVLIILIGTICTAPIRMALYAARIGWTSTHQTGTDITTQQSVWFLGFAAAGATSGLLAGTIGWAGFFSVNVVLTTAALLFFITSHDDICARVKVLNVLPA
ncbi:MAG: MFS transporter [Pseudomonadota bacterium]